MNPHYPFTAIVGQESMKLALSLNAINPKIGGVLIRGQKGTAKSTAVRGLAGLLPDIHVLDGCRFRCAPDDSAPACPECTVRDVRTSHIEPVPLVELPIGATEDRLIGTLDIERALAEGQRHFEPGLLARANRGLLYVDEVNLLPDHLVDTLLDAAAMGTNTVERDGISFSHPASFVLVGTMNPEEGELRPQLLDRFGLAVDIAGMPDTAERAEIVRRRIAFDQDPAEFVRRSGASEDAERARIRAAQLLLPAVQLDDRLLELIAHICTTFEVDGMRADIVMYRTATTLAAYAGRQRVTVDDIRQAAELALPHRRRRQPFDDVGLDQNKLESVLRDFSDEPPDSPPPSAGPEDDPPPSPDNRGGQPPSSETPPQVFDFAAAADINLPPPMTTRRHSGTSRTRARLTEGPRGRHIRSAPLRGGSLDILATLASAATRSHRHGVRITRGDMRFKIRAFPSGVLTVFVVDASGSMAARRRMAVAKGAIRHLLQHAYQSRQEVALVALRGSDASVVLPPTSSIDLASSRLSDLPTGGRTPLALGLRRAATLLRQRRRTRITTSAQRLVLVSDGRANVPLSDGGDPYADALREADQLRNDDVQSVVVDSEDGPVRLHRARALAAALGADYVPLGGAQP